MWSSLLINYVDTLNRNDTIELFNQLIKSLWGKINAPNATNQYAILCIPSDLNGAADKRPNFVPELQYLNVLLEQYPQQRITDGVASNYLITRPQKIGNRWVHTEVLLLDDVHGLYSGMLQHLRNLSGNANTTPKEIYLYSFNQPCFECSGAIQRFVHKLSNTQTEFVVGFTTDKWNWKKDKRTNRYIKDNPDAGLHKLIDVLCTTGQHRLVVVPSNKRYISFSMRSDDGQL